MDRKITFEELKMEYDFAVDVMNSILNDFSFENVCKCNNYFLVEVNGERIKDIVNEFDRLSLKDGSVDMLRVETAHFYLYAFYDDEYELNENSACMADIMGECLPHDINIGNITQEHLDMYFTDENNEIEVDKYYGSLSVLYNDFRGVE
jgi:hypothetical protein